MDEKERAILDFLKKNGKSCVKDIADGTDMSSATASKYLLSLLNQGKVKKEIKRPFHYYEVVE